MVYKRYIKKAGKFHGPYYYESYRNKKGKVVSRFVSGPTIKDNLFNKINLNIHRKLRKAISTLFLIIFIFLITGGFFWLFVRSFISTIS